MKMARPLKYGALAPAIGALITAMNGLNSRLAELAGKLVAAVVIHVVGLATVSIILLFRREAGKPGRVPFYCYLGGMVGVGTVFSSAYAFSNLGASLTVALALIGQSLFSLAADATGVLGRPRYPLKARRVPGIALALAGAAIMAGPLRANIPALLAALVSGAIPGLSFVLNAELGRRKGLFTSTRINYLTGLATTFAVFLILRPPFAPAIQAIASAGPFLVLGGGIMGVVVVTSMNLIIPKMPVFSATILVFSGQVAAGLLIDFASSGHLDAGKLAGTALLLGGLALDAALTRRPARELEADTCTQR